MPVRTGVPRVTHQWLKPVLDYIDQMASVTVPSGASGIANGVWIGKTVPTTQISNATGVAGFFGFTGIGPIATGGNGVLSATALGASGFPATGLGASGFYTSLANAALNGGSGTPYTLNDIVVQLKNLGILKQ